MEERFVNLYDLYKDDVFRLSYSYLKDYFDADDLLQNVFIKLYKHKEIMKLTDVEVKKWLFRVTINESKNKLMSFWKRKVHNITEQEEDKINTLINDSEVLNAIMQLKQKERIIIYLYYFEGYKIKEIASILKLTETNIQTILSRARLELKNKLGEDINE